MGNIMERTCRNCGKVYKFKSTPSFIAFCSHCKMFDYSKCKYVFPVTECTVFMGDEIIGTVKVYTGDTCVYDGDTIYDISVPDLGITETLKTKYDPLIDAAYVIIDNLSKKYGLMDIRNGKLILLGERLCRGYTFRQFKKSSMYTGQNAKKTLH